MAVEAEFLLGADGEGGEGLARWPWRAARPGGAAQRPLSWAFGAGNSVFYVGLISALEPCAGVGSINAALSRDDLWMN